MKTRLKCRIGGWLLAALIFMSGKHAAAATATATAAVGVFAIGAGVDPVPWILGGICVTIVYAYKTPQTRPIALANALISILLGGIGGPLAADVLHAHGYTEWAKPYAFSCLFAAGWPWIVPWGWGVLQNAFSGFSFKKGEKHGQ